MKSKAFPAASRTFPELSDIREAAASFDGRLSEVGIVDFPEGAERWADQLSDLEKGAAFISENVKKSFDIADNLSKTAQEAFSLSEHAQVAIKAVTETLSDSIRQTGILYEQSAEISKIIEIMSSISSKTHVLSINASIVATRAGTKGNSFAVVAREIRNLSSETEKSLASIEELVGAIRGSIDSVVGKTKEANDRIANEKKSLMSVAGALQGALLAVEIIRTVSSLAREKSDEQKSVFEELIRFLRQLHERIMLAEKNFSIIEELPDSFARVRALLAQLEEPEKPS